MKHTGAWRWSATIDQARPSASRASGSNVSGSNTHKMGVAAPGSHCSHG